MAKINLRKEQRATLDRPPRNYSWLARFFFAAFDLLAGKQTTLHKLKLLEILAAIPYRAWENRHYLRLSRSYADEEKRSHSLRLIAWTRQAQDNEYRHLLVLQGLIEEMGEKKPFYHLPFMTRPLIFSYRLFSWTLARISIRRALFFNAEFEDHAEHVYARFAGKYPEWENRPVVSPAARAYGEFAGWADLFRRIALDERDHRNSSLLFCGRPREMALYENMPEDQAN